MEEIGFVDKTYTRNWYVDHRRPKTDLFCQSVISGSFRTKNNFQIKIIDCYTAFCYLHADFHCGLEFHLQPGRHPQ